MPRKEGRYTAIVRPTQMPYQFRGAYEDIIKNRIPCKNTGHAIRYVVYAYIAAGPVNGISATEIANVTGLHPTTIRPAISLLMQQGYVQKISGSPYRRAPKTAKHTPPPTQPSQPKPARSIELHNDVQQASAAALVALEHALVRKVRTAGTVTDEQTKRFERYQNIKARYLRPGTDAEGQTALRLAIVEIVKLLF